MLRHCRSESPLRFFYHIAPIMKSRKLLKYDSIQTWPECTIRVAIKLFTDSIRIHTCIIAHRANIFPRLCTNGLSMHFICNNWQIYAILVFTVLHRLHRHCRRPNFPLRRASIDWIAGGECHFLPNLFPIYITSLASSYNAMTQLPMKSMSLEKHNPLVDCYELLRISMVSWEICTPGKHYFIAMLEKKTFIWTVIKVQVHIN